MDIVCPLSRIAVTGSHCGIRALDLKEPESVRQMHISLCPSEPAALSQSQFTPPSHKT